MLTRLQKLTNALGSRYEVERELGSGATATVFLANDVRYQRRVAVKVFRAEIAEALGHERFVREIALVATLNHPHIVPLLDSGEVEDMMFYVMPAVEGESLRDRLSREGRISIDESVQIARDVAVALDYAHGRNVVHRDIKPENILLTAGTAVVADFGIAKMLNPGNAGASITTAGMALGTVAYMSPEQASAGSVDGRTDIYALGCVLFEMLTGRPPFIGKSAREVVSRHFTEPVPSMHRLCPDVAPNFEQAINRALAKSAEDRFATATEFLNALATARRSASRERMWKQLGGTTPPPKSGEWRGKEELAAMAGEIPATLHPPKQPTAMTPAARSEPQAPGAVDARPRDVGADRGKRDHLLLWAVPIAALLIAAWWYLHR